MTDYYPPQSGAVVTYDEPVCETQTPLNLTDEIQVTEQEDEAFERMGALE
jgi:hypothetical protein